MIQREWAEWQIHQPERYNALISLTKGLLLMTLPMPSRVDFSVLNLNQEIVIRAGDLRQSSAKRYLLLGYTIDARYNDVYGLSTVFRQGATWHQLAQFAQFPNGKIAFATIAEVMQELANVGYELVLFVTPTINRSDHCTLGVMKNGQIAPNLEDIPATALIRAFSAHVIDNPYRGQP